MREVKILLAQDVEIDDYSQSIIRESISDWEQISDEDYTLLREKFHHIFNGLGYQWKPVLLVKDDKPVIQRIERIKKLVDEQRKRDEEYERKKQEAISKRAATKKAKEKELFDQLAKKYAK